MLLSATHDDIVKLYEELEAFAKREGWTSKVEFDLKLVLEELFINIVDYGDCPGTPVRIAFTSEQDRLTIEISDSGRPFNPLVDAPEVDTSLPIEDRTIGGLGVHLVHKLMDEVNYRRDGDLNRLTLVKSRNE
ncbi:MAG: ATP-binding protein [Rhodospirillaceae bacterium]|nr:ATP-binding protein [Rhodospirillaceae bacterium]